MKDYVIITDSTADLPDSLVQKYHIEIIPLYYNMEGTVYGGDKNLEYKEFYDKMRSGIMPTTMASNPEYVMNLFRKYMEQGIDILNISFSSALSSSYSTEYFVGNEFAERYPEQKIITIDSLCASLGQGLLVYKAVKMKEAGASLEECASWIEENKLHICHQFTVEDLNHLHRGGRVSKTTAVLGTMINIKPILHVDNEGKLTPLSKVRGRKKSLIELVDNMEKTMGRYKNQNDVVFISHGDSLEDANYVAELIKERFQIEQIVIGDISPTIGAHAGPGTIALFYLGESR